MRYSQVMDDVMFYVFFPRLSEHLKTRVANAVKMQFF